MSTCPALGCLCQVRPGKLMCPQHWHSLPQDVRDRVIQTWRLFHDPGAPGRRADRWDKYLEAQRAAIDALKAQQPILAEKAA